MNRSSPLGRRLASRAWLLPLAVLLLPGPADAADAADDLAAYVRNADESSSVTVRSTGSWRGSSYRELRLVSQTWRGVPWQHQLFLIKPKYARPDQPVLLFISGGKWKPAYDAPPVPGELPRDAPIFVRLAERLRAPVAVLGQVPFQPMFDGLREDALIAYTFDEYLRTGQPDWPLLLPMVKAARVAMDAVSADMRAAWQIPADHFMVAGASKRGWTTWLTAATADPRVLGIAPMVFDVLDMPRQLAHQEATWGEPSVEIQDYTERQLVERVLSPDGDRLLAIIDPWRYRARLTQPKLIVLATNDAYWPVDAANIYLDGLPGDNRLLYVPNSGHSIRDLPRLISGFAALHRAIASGRPLPRLTWTHAVAAGKAELRFSSDAPTARARVWFARSPSRDFRDARWRAREVRRGRDGSYTLRLPVAAGNYLALFGEAVYGRGSGRYYLSTGLRVAGAEGLLPLTAAADDRGGPAPALAPGGSP